MNKTVKDLEPVVRIGKQGLTENILKEIEKQLKKKKIIKVKVLSSCLEGKDKKYKKEIMKEIAEKTNSELIKRVGFTGIFQKK